MSDQCNSGGSASSLMSSAAELNRPAARNTKAPVFVLGCPRSGTTVLYHMLLSAGGVAVHSGEPKLFKIPVARVWHPWPLKNTQRRLVYWVCRQTVSGFRFHHSD